MRTENRLNVDVLLYQNDPLTLSLTRVLQKYPDLTLFTLDSIGDIVPDIIIFTETDPYRCVQQVREVPVAHRCSKFVYMRKYFDCVTIGLMQYIGIINLLSTELKPHEIHSCLKTIGVAPVSEMSRKKVTKFYNKYYGYMLRDGITFKQHMVLGARVRGYSWRKTHALLGMNHMRFNLEVNLARKILGLSTKDTRSIANALKYGGIVVEDRFRHYRIPANARYKHGYYLLPRIEEASES